MNALNKTHYTGKPILAEVTLDGNTDVNKRIFIFNAKLTWDAKPFPVKIVVSGNSSVSLGTPKNQPYLFSDSGVDVARISTGQIAAALKEKLAADSLMALSGLTMSNGENRKNKTKIEGILTNHIQAAGRAGFVDRSI